MFKGRLKEIEKIKKLTKLTESDSPITNTEIVDTTGNKLIYSNI